MLRRILLLLLTIAMLVPFAACGGTEAEQSDSLVESGTGIGSQAGTEDAVSNTEPSVLATVYPTVDTGIKLPDMIEQSYLDTIKATLDSKPYASALYYVDLETGLSVCYNSERMFGGASLIKAPYIMTVFEDLRNGKLSYEDTITYTAGVKRGGTTKIPQDFKFGDEITIRQLLEYLIWYSDNTAFSMFLHNVHSYDAFARWAKARYGTTFTYSGCSWLNAKGVAECWKEIYEHYKNGDEHYQWFVSLLLEANENKFIRDGLPKDANGECLYKVAHKYGMDINASNDAAIVFYEDRPYFLVLLTDYIGYNTRSFMNEVSSEVFAMHEHICSFDD
ncbi:MAG: serine hydrolase [Clostridia bacterium]|nr:serine hydrolase [Clostridia bacterium]